MKDARRPIIGFRPMCRLEAMRAVGDGSPHVVITGSAEANPDEHRLLETADACWLVIREEEDDHRDEVADAIAWGERHRAGIVSCDAGVCRSPAIAYVLAAARLPVDEAIRVLDPTLHVPHHGIVRVGAEILGRPAILAEYLAFREMTRLHRAALQELYDRACREFNVYPSVRMVRRGEGHRWLIEVGQPWLCLRYTGHRRARFLERGDTARLMGDAIEISYTQ